VLRRLGLAVGGATLAFSLLLVVEIFHVMRKEFLPTEPALDIRGTYGPEDGRPLSFMVLGDSTAAGLGAGAEELSYPVRLAERLGRDGFRVTLTGVGISGARTGDVLREQVPLVERGQPDLVFVGIGANDVIHMTPLSRVRRDMTSVLERLVSSAGAVVAGGVPDMRAAAFPEPLRSIVGWRGREVTGEIQRAAATAGVRVVPIAEGAGPYFIEDPEDAYAEDWFHPGPGGYRRWASVIYPYLSDALTAAGVL
jgi:lysophospholipase L1-like esterase